MGGSLQYAATMKRRTLLKSAAAAFVARPLSTLEASPPQDDALTPERIATLDAIAEVVLPSAIGDGGRRDAVAAFVAWIRNYRSGADTGHSYGSSTLSRPTGPSPAARYPDQFTALDAAARAAGGRTFASLGLDTRRQVVEATLNGNPRVTRLPSRPTGANLIADLMGMYFNGADAFDLCYDAEIGRDNCRSLDGSDRAPAPRRRG
jgi:hypothetical protein